MNSFFSSSSGYPSLEPFDHCLALSSARNVPFDAKQSSVTCCTTDQTAKYIATSFIGRHDTIGDHKCSRTDMVCDQTDGNIILMVFLVFLARNLTYQVTQVHMIVSTSKIESTSCTTTARRSRPIPVSIFFCFSVSIIAISVILKLGEYIVPYFHVTVAVTAYGTAWLATAIFLSTVIVDL